MSAPFQIGATTSAFESPFGFGSRNQFRAVCAPTVNGPARQKPKYEAPSFSASGSAVVRSSAVASVLAFRSA